MNFQSRILVALILIGFCFNHDLVAQCTSPTVADVSNSCSSPGVPFWLTATSTNACGKVITHKWYLSSTGTTTVNNTVLSTGTCAVYYTGVQVSVSSTFWVSAIIDGCESPRVKVMGNVYRNDLPVLNLGPSIKLNGDEFSGGNVPLVNGIGKVNLTAAGGASTSTYEWYDAPTGGVLLATGSSYLATISGSEGGSKTFYVGGTLRNTLGCSFPITPRKSIKVDLISYQNWINYVRTYTPLRKISSTSAVWTSAASDVSREIQYFDGLGRPIQNIVKEASPQLKDIVQSFYYDGFGRESRKYLPVTYPSSNNGDFVPGIIDVNGKYSGVVENFYNTANDKIPDDPLPFAATIVEGLANRVVKVGGTGAAWQPTPATVGSYPNYSQSIDWRNFVTNIGSGGGGATITILNNILTVKFDAGFTSSPLKTGNVANIYTNNLFDVELGTVCNGNYTASIKNGAIHISSNTTTPVSVGGIYGTFNVDLLGHAITTSYSLNTSNEVLKWTYALATRLIDAGSITSLNYFLPNKLVVKKTYDEHDKMVMEYLDERGRVMLKRVQVGAPQTPVNDTNFASTYYVYDDFDNLVCVIPPEATRLLPTDYFHTAATDATRESFLDRWAFRYSYDRRRRMSEKQVPGGGSVFFGLRQA
jgi:hypothetical protein